MRPPTGFPWWATKLPGPGEANWKTFLEHPEWEQMKNKEIYADTVSNITQIFLRPTDYSQV